MTPDDPLPPSDEVEDPGPPPGRGTSEEEPGDSPDGPDGPEVATAPVGRRSGDRKRGVRWPDRVPESWRDTVAVPRWEVATAIGLITVLLAVAIAAGGLALTQSTSPPEAAGSPAAVAISDDFRRGSQESLGVAPTGQVWDELQGDWGVGFGTAQILRPDGNLPSLTTVDLGDTDGLVRMRIGTVTTGMGVAVRVRDAGTYLAIEAEPSFGTYAIRRSVNGQITELGGVGLANAADGALVEVRMRGDSVDIYIEGTYVKTVTDRPEPDATGVGLIGLPGTAEARWVHFDAQNTASLTQGLPAQPDTTTTEG